MADHSLWNLSSDPTFLYSGRGRPKKPEDSFCHRKHIANFTSFIMAPKQLEAADGRVAGSDGCWFWISSALLCPVAGGTFPEGLAVAFMQKGRQGPLDVRLWLSLLKARQQVWPDN